MFQFANDGEIKMFFYNRYHIKKFVLRSQNLLEEGGQGLGQKVDIFLYALLKLVKYRHLVTCSGTAPPWRTRSTTPSSPTASSPSTTTLSMARCRVSLQLKRSNTNSSLAIYSMGNVFETDV